MCMRTFLQMEVDFKAECQAGDTVLSSVLALHEGGGIGAGTASTTSTTTTSEGLRYFLHTLSRSDESGSTELVRARTSWRRAEA